VKIETKEIDLQTH